MAAAPSDPSQPWARALPEPSVTEAPGSAQEMPLQVGVGVGVGECSGFLHLRWTGQASCHQTASCLPLAV